MNAFSTSLKLSIVSRITSFKVGTKILDNVKLLLNFLDIKMMRYSATVKFVSVCQTSVKCKAS